MRIFSGIRPTGGIHIGNYLGAIKNWLSLQKEHDCFFCVVDWHAITTPYRPDDLAGHIEETARAYLAAGISPEKSIFFLQSMVKEHTELAWLLGTITPVGELKRMAQYKEKSKKTRGSPNVGLLSYPVLMAADILLYQTDAVPVGEDQVQHVELARKIARKFNNKFGKTFKMPKAITPEYGTRIMSLSSPKAKMSKTGDEKGCIELFEKPESIREKVMSAVTDPGKKIEYNLEQKPGISNLITIHSLFSNKKIAEIEKQFESKGYAEFKKELAQLLIDSLKPFREAEKEFSSKDIWDILEKGAKKARETAQKTMKEVREKMGLSQLQNS